jgi:hypothetical protein
MGTGLLDEFGELLPAVAVVAVSAVSSNRMLGRSMGFVSGQCQNHKHQNARRGLKRRSCANSNYRDALNVCLGALHRSDEVSGADGDALVVRF